VDFEYSVIRSAHLMAVVELCRRESYSSYTVDEQRTWRALTAPGVVTVVALNDDQVVGFAQVQSDGEIQAHLSLIVVDRDFRKQGIGRELIQEVFKQIGADRIDLITEDAQSFYRSLPHKEWIGFRIYPLDAAG